MSLMNTPLPQFSLNALIPLSFIPSIWPMILTESSLRYYSPIISNISNIEMVINQNSGSSSRAIIPENVFFRIQKLRISTLVRFTYSQFGISKNFGCFMRLSKRCSFKYSAAREPP